MKEKDGQLLSYRSRKTAGEFKACLPGQTERFSAEQRHFLLRETDENALMIGIEKGDHAGYWYVASLTDEPGGCRIEGRIVYDPDNDTADGKSLGVGEILGMIVIGVIFLIPILLFLLVRLFIDLVRRPKTKEEYLDLFMTGYLGCEKIE